MGEEQTKSPAILKPWQLHTQIQPTTAAISIAELLCFPTNHGRLLTDIKKNSGMPVLWLTSPRMVWSQDGPPSSAYLYFQKFSNHTYEQPLSPYEFIGPDPQIFEVLDHVAAYVAV